MIRKIAVAVTINVALIGVLVMAPVLQGAHNPPGLADGKFGYGYLPGWGHGDRNHDHSGPPGLAKEDLLPPIPEKEDLLPPIPDKEDLLPPGLNKNNVLPPGLAGKDELPPGTSKKQ